MDAPAVAVRDGIITVAWMDRRGGRADLWLATAAKGRFQPEAALPRESAGEQHHPHLAAAGMGVVAVWTHGGRKGLGEIRLRAADGTERTLHPEGGGYARVAAAGKQVWVVHQAGDGAAATVRVHRLP
ncbi:MAG: hypothetical protein ACYTGX_08285 [Planctomycetota bacterium]|jgi:hypothetical protein